MNGWICDVCGSVAEGEMCMKCGNPRALVSPKVTASGSYWSILGIHNEAGFRGYGLVAGGVVGLVVIAAVTQSVPLMLGVVGAVALYFLVRYLPVLYYRMRR